MFVAYQFLMSRLASPQYSLDRQRGNIFLFYALVFITVIMGIIVGQLLPSNNQQARAAADQQVLAAAANGILNWGLSHTNASNSAPFGMLPYPNSGLPTGLSVCPAPPGPAPATSRIGYFPYLGEPANPPSNCRSVDNTPTRAVGWMDLNLSDSSGSRLWYAVAAPVLDNPTTAPAYPTITPASLAAATNQLFTVCDANGNATPNVVFVVFAPGPAVAGQNRAAQGVAANFLDSTSLAGAAPCNGVINNANIAGRVFVAGSLSDTFNDQVYYVTLAQYLDRLVPNVMRNTLAQIDLYHVANGSYPSNITASNYWLAWDGSTTPNANSWSKTVSIVPQTATTAFMTITGCTPPAVPAQFTLTWNAATSSSSVSPSFSQCL